MRICLHDFVLSDDIRGAFDYSWVCVHISDTLLFVWLYFQLRNWADFEAFSLWVCLCSITSHRPVHTIFQLDNTDKRCAQQEDFGQFAHSGQLTHSRRVNKSYQ
jgi:hypothetical protein